MIYSHQVHILSIVHIPAFNLRWNFALRFAAISAFLFVFSLLIFYIYQINTLTKDSFLLKAKEKELLQIIQKNKNLESLVSKANSLANLEVLLNGLNYEKVEKVYYIRVMAGQVVAK